LVSLDGGSVIVVVVVLVVVAAGGGRFDAVALRCEGKGMGARFGRTKPVSGTPVDATEGFGGAGGSFGAAGASF
jgi:uncharacterized membrane protein YgcG